MGVSPRHIQHLCKDGKINGAVKNKNIWLIPDGTNVLLKNTKKGDGNFNFIGTKKLIFENAINLFADKGIEEVSIKDIADSSGIRQSTLYNHFKSKQEILDNIYESFYDCIVKARPQIEALEPIIKNGTILDIIQSLRGELNGEIKQEIYKMFKIICQRIPIDKRASELVKTLLVEDFNEFVEEVINKAVELGRFEQRDSKTIAVFINSLVIYNSFHWIVDPTQSNMEWVRENEIKLYKYVADLLTKSMPEVD